MHCSIRFVQLSYVLCSHCLILFVYKYLVVCPLLSREISGNVCSQLRTLVVIPTILNYPYVGHTMSQGRYCLQNLPSQYEVVFYRFVWGVPHSLRHVSKHGPRY